MTVSLDYLKQIFYDFLLINYIIIEKKLLSKIRSNLFMNKKVLATIGLIYLLVTAN